MTTVSVDINAQLGQIKEEFANIKKLGYSQDNILKMVAFEEKLLNLIKVAFGESSEWYSSVSEIMQRSWHPGVADKTTNEAKVDPEFDNRMKYTEDVKRYEDILNKISNSLSKAQPIPTAEPTPTATTSPTFPSTTTTSTTTTDASNKPDQPTPTPEATATAKPSTSTTTSTTPPIPSDAATTLKFKVQFQCYIESKTISDALSTADELISHFKNTGYGVSGISVTSD